MSSDPSALFERVNTSFSKLSSAAKDLNSVSDELGRAISAIDLVLQRLNLGVPSWVEVIGEADDFHYWSRDIGYAKIKNKWGIALRAIEGNTNFPDEESGEAWLFNDAPRWQRIESVEKIPDLIDRLVRDAQATTERIKAKMDHAKQLAEAFKQAEQAPQPPPGTEAAIEYIERTYGKNKGKSTTAVARK